MLPTPAHSSHKRQKPNAVAAVADNRHRGGRIEYRVADTGAVWRTDERGPLAIQFSIGRSRSHGATEAGRREREGEYEGTNYGGRGGREQALLRSKIDRHRTHRARQATVLDRSKKDRHDETRDLGDLESTYVSCAEEHSVSTSSTTPRRYLSTSSTRARCYFAIFDFLNLGCDFRLGSTATHTPTFRFEIRPRLGQERLRSKRRQTH